MTPEELTYYRERSRIERARAAESTNPHVVEIHEKLAMLYEKLVAIEDATPPMGRAAEVRDRLEA